jgi:hypothetical protein
VLRSAQLLHVARKASCHVCLSTAGWPTLICRLPSSPLLPSHEEHNLAGQQPPAAIGSTPSPPSPHTHLLNLLQWLSLAPCLGCAICDEVGRDLTNRSTRTPQHASQGNLQAGTAAGATVGSGVATLC